MPKTVSYSVTRMPGDLDAPPSGGMRNPVLASDLLSNKGMRQRSAEGIAAFKTAGIWRASDSDEVSALAPTGRRQRVRSLRRTMVPDAPSCFSTMRVIGARVSSAESDHRVRKGQKGRASYSPAMTDSRSEADLSYP